MEILSVFQPFLKGRAIAALVAVMLLMPIVYLFGPMIEIGGFRPLESEINRMIVCVVLFILTLVIIWVVDRRKSHRDMLLVAGIAAPDPSADRAADLYRAAACGAGPTGGLHRLLVLLPEPCRLLPDREVLPGRLATGRTPA